MPDVSREDLAKYRIENAEECLETARFMCEMGKYVVAVNRSYYAIFHAIRAVFALEGVDRKKHSGVISYFQQKYIKTGVLIRNFRGYCRMRLR